MLTPCPANYFGRGENFDLNELSREELVKFDELWKQWEIDHPEDPTGEAFLQREKDLAGTKIQVYHPTPEKSHPRKVTVFEAVEMDDGESTRLKLELPPACIEKLKNFARMQRRRPRDIIRQWVEEHCKC